LSVKDRTSAATLQTFYYPIITKFEIRHFRCVNASLEFPSGCILHLVIIFLSLLPYLLCNLTVFCLPRASASTQSRWSSWPFQLAFPSFILMYETDLYFYTMSLRVNPSILCDFVLSRLQACCPGGVTRARARARVHEFATCNPPDDFIINRTEVHNYRWGGERESWGAVRRDPCSPERRERRGVPSTCLSLSFVFTRRKAEPCVRSRAPRLKRTSAGKGHVGARSGRVKWYAPPVFARSPAHASLAD